MTTYNQQQSGCEEIQYDTAQQLKRKQEMIEKQVRGKNERFWISSLIFGSMIILGFVYFTILLKGWNQQIKKQGQLQSKQFRDETEVAIKNIKQQISVFQKKIQAFKSDSKNRQTKYLDQIKQVNQRFEDLKLKTIKINQLIIQKNQKIQQKNLLNTQTKILRPSQIKTILTFFNHKIKTFNLLFRASQHQFSAQQFHKTSDHKKNTLLLIKTQHNNIIGGFTPLPWDKDHQGQLKDQSKSTFIFSLQMNQKMTLINSNLPAIRNSKNDGPIFGSQKADLMIVDESNKKQNSLEFPFLYNNEKKYKKQQKTTKLFLGNNNNKFKTKQWQIFEVVFIQQL